MEKIVRKFKTFEDAERHEWEFYRSLAPQQRLDMLLQIIKDHDGEVEEGFKRVYRITKLPRS